MDIRFPCTKCGQHLAIDDTGAGQIVQCPKCNQSLTVPPSSVGTPQDSEQPAPVSSSSTAASETVEDPTASEPEAENPANDNADGGSVKNNNVILIGWLAVVITFGIFCVWIMFFDGTEKTCPAAPPPGNAAPGTSPAASEGAQTITDSRNPFAELKAKAEAGDAEAQFNLGSCYTNGQGVPKDEVEAAKWYHKAAEHNHAEAQNHLGYCYANGLGVANNGVEAMKWWLKAADQNCAEAQYALGWCSEHGSLGVETNLRNARQWYELAARKGYRPAAEQLQQLRKYIIGWNVSASVDERLFLLLILERMYNQWPSYTANQNEFTKAAAELRFSAIRYLQHIRDSNLDSELVQLFEDYKDTLDAYTSFLVNISKIKAEGMDRANKDAASTGFNAGWNGALVADTMSQNAYSTSEAALGGLVAAGITAVVDWQKKAKLREEAQRQAVADAVKPIQDKWMSSLARAQNVAETLGHKYNWGRSEVGFENFRSPVETGNTNGLINEAGREVAKRPRDPFPRLKQNLLESVQDNTTIETMLANARDCVESASLVPAGRIYDRYRHACLIYAGRIARLARLKEVRAGIRPLGSTEMSHLAVAIFDKAEEFGFGDPTGECGENRARALLANNEVSRAWKQANDVYDVRTHSYAFNYFYACIMSRAGHNDKSLEFLRVALNQGFNQIGWVKRDPDLTAMRKGVADTFSELVSVKTKWGITWGILNDDITLTNNSEFPITHAHLKVHLEQDSQAWDRNLEADQIGRGQTYRWTDVISVPGSRLTKSSATLTCDQN